MQDYENMTKEQLIAEVKSLNIIIENLNKMNEVVGKENQKLEKIVNLIQFVVEQCYNDIRSIK
jgi:hypothetical protein